MASVTYIYCTLEGSLASLNTYHMKREEEAHGREGVAGGDGGVPDVRACLADGLGRQHR
jgi:hypothetical protein